MKKVLVSTASLLMLSFSAAAAADLPARTFVIAPVAPPVFTWAGPYVGVNAGYSQANGKTDYNYAYAPADGTANFADYFGSGAENNPYPAGPLNVSGLNAAESAIALGVIPRSLGSSSRGGFAGGVQAGYNWQSGSFVYGVEADFDGLTNKSSGGFVTVIPRAYTNAGSASASISWLATARLRAGLAFDRTLVYATGGIAAGGVKASSSSIGTDGSTYDTFLGSVSKTRFGWTVGAGVEYALTDRWLLRGEGLYYNLGRVSYGVNAQDANTLSEGLSITARHKADGFVLRTGLSYKF